MAGGEGGRGSPVLPDLPATCDATAVAVSPVSSTAPAAPQVRRIGMHVGEGGLAPAAEEQPWPRKPAALRRGSHPILPGLGTLQASATRHLAAPVAEEA